MYSNQLQRLIKSASIRIGQEVIVTTARKKYKGILMPSTELGDPDSLIIKLDNGYNVGLKFDRHMKLEKGGKKPKKVKEEYEYELGKKKKVEKLEFDKKNPSVSLITTGGTITSRVDYKTGGVKSLMDPDELLSIAPEIADVVYIKDIIWPFSKMSEDMDYKDWQRIAETVAKEINHEQGGIVTHGTDTLHYTAAALSFMLKNLSKPVVLTGAQRSSDRGSTDTAMNLICSAYVAGHSKFAEVGICMHGNMDDNYCLFTRGTKVKKMHTSRRDTFRPINDLPLAKIYSTGKIEIVKKDYNKRSKKKVKADTKFEPRVMFIKAYPGSDPEIMDHYISKKYKGFVVEGTGLGHVPTQAEQSWIPHIRKVVDQGIPVVVTSQAFYGRINTSVYANLRTLFYDAGAIPGEDMLPETAYVKLGWVLGHTNDLEKVRHMMLENYAGEITKRTLPETFLY